MKKFNRLQRILLVVISVIFIFGCIMFSLCQNTLSNVGYSTWTYIKYGMVNYPIKSLGSMVSDVSNLWHVYEDNKYLNEQLAKQRSYETMYLDEKNKNKELENLLEIDKAHKDEKTVHCKVLGRSFQTWEESFTISAGKNKGIEPDMLVMNSLGAVGIVDSVQTSTSTVRLLTSKELINEISVEIALEDGTSIEGVLQSYDANRQAYKVNLFDHNAIVSKGQLVATSGKGGKYTSGIFVGTVMDTVMGDDAIISSVYVKPVSNMQSFSYVTVIGNGAVKK